MQPLMREQPNRRGTLVGLGIDGARTAPVHLGGPEILGQAGDTECPQSELVREILSRCQTLHQLNVPKGAVVVLFDDEGNSEARCVGIGSVLIKRNGVPGARREELSCAIQPDPPRSGSPGLMAR
jgi:hypothetical protein